MFFPIAIVGIVFGSALIFTKLIIDYKRAAARNAPSTDKSLSTSELRNMIDAAVEEASAPLLERLERLEMRSGKTMGRASDEQDAYSLPLDEVSHQTEVRRRTR